MLTYGWSKAHYFIGLRLGLRMDFLLCPILRPNILGHILFKLEHSNIWLKLL